ncbi:hypothetical protein DN412_29465 [Cupriavidus lacunae]|uniref:Uncharacterized protein n=1 Tax=Cupriavidus lacunae TaxID=2666307 RepID=A0A370NMI9_9BURK|nr:hypothetical protein DN412_29465 [Cupriavidus lacunae]
MQLRAQLTPVKAQGVATGHTVGRSVRKAHYSCRELPAGTTFVTIGNDSASLTYLSGCFRRLCFKDDNNTKETR